jgi:hypothetical protein
MEHDAGGGLWLLINVVAVAILAAAMIYGTMQWHKRRRSRGLEQQRNQATRELYQQERQ